MQIFIDAEGNATIVAPQHIYQGSNISQVNVVSLAFTPQTTLQIAFVLPDGTTTNYYPMSFNYSSTSTNYYQYIIQQAFTTLSGSASIALLATDSTTKQQTSQLIPFTIEPSVLPTLPDTPSQDEWTTLLQYVQQNSSNIANLQAIISDIETIANTANTNASQAVSIANEALSTAQQAEQTANGLAGSIAQANTNASKAVSTANEAKTTADGLAESIAQANETANEAKTTADGLAESIAQANETANEAKTTASQAVTTANQANTTASQAVTTANQANETAQEALEQVIAGEGTKVTVDGQTVKTLDFDTDPQTQINEINAQLSTTLEKQSATFSGDMSEAQYLQLGTLVNFEANQAPIKIHIYGKVLLSSLSLGDFDFEIIVPFTNIAQSNTARIIQYTNGVDESSTCVNQIILDGTAVIIKVARNSDTVIPYNVLSIGSDFTISPSILTDYEVNGSATVLNCETTGFQVAYGAIDNLSSTNLTVDTINGQPVKMYTTIYDYSSDDSAINLGYPNGIYANSGTDGVVDINFTLYKFLKIYVKYAQNDNAIVFCDLTAPQIADQDDGNTYKFTNISMAESNPPSGARYAVQIVIPFTLNSLQIRNIGYFTSTNEWTSRNPPINDSIEYLIYRIEGVK